jgi:holo-[acyl-carrier protein] synthase
MHTKLGIDITHIQRFERLMQNKSFIKKVFHRSEISKKYNSEHLAGIFAAKEAFFKAVNKKQKINPKWHDVEVKNGKNGKPELLISKNLQKYINETDVSISHDKDYAIAAVICQIKNVK